MSQTEEKLQPPPGLGVMLVFSHMSWVVWPPSTESLASAASSRQMRVVWLNSAMVTVWVQRPGLRLGMATGPAAGALAAAGAASPEAAAVFSSFLPQAARASTATVTVNARRTIRVLPEIVSRPG